MKCKNCDVELRWCEVHKIWEHCDAERLYSRRCLAKTVAEPESASRAEIESNKTYGSNNEIQNVQLLSIDDIMKSIIPSTSFYNATNEKKSERHRFHKNKVSDER